MRKTSKLTNKPKIHLFWDFHRPSCDANLRETTNLSWHLPRKQKGFFELVGCCPRKEFK